MPSITKVGGHLKSLLSVRKRIHAKPVAVAGWLAASLFVFGCSGGDEPGSPRVLRSETVQGPPPNGPLPDPAYQFEYLQPEQRDFRPGEEIEFRAKMTLPEGEKPPSSVILLVRRGKVNVNSVNLEATDDSGAGTYEFNTRLRVPQEKGQYDLVLMVIKIKSYQTKGHDPESRSSTVYSKPMAITVREKR